LDYNQRKWDFILPLTTYIHTRIHTFKLKQVNNKYDVLIPSKKKKYDVLIKIKK